MNHPGHFALPAGIALHAYTHRAMNCDWGILIADAPEPEAAAAARAAFAEVDRVERDLSRFIPTSDIARLNHASVGAPTRVAPAAWDCLTLAAEVWRDTGGAFDVTIGAALLAPAPASLAPDAIGMQRLRLAERDRTATRLSHDLVIDLGAIGKGYGVDRAVETLREWRITTALVHSGQSTLFALGAPPDRKDWEIAIRNPLVHTQILGQVRLSNRAFSGSGVHIHGRHIIDPHRGRPATDRTGAWALATSAALSDAVSTAFMVMPDAEIAAYCESHPDTAALVANAASTGALKTRSFGAGWYLTDAPPPP